MNALLAPYKALIDEALLDALDSFGPKNRFRDAIEYSLKNAGKRLRPILVHLIAKALGMGHDVNDAALAIEFFHTASLIADDLPCMDNARLRREVPTLHVAFDEATAILATYALISAGYDRIRLNARKQNNPNSGLLAIESASFNTGIFGASGGQYFDLFPEEQTGEMRVILEKKTATLFEISFVFGWIFGGGALDKLEHVKRLAYHFGMAFQISDDFFDLQEDKNFNYFKAVGHEKAKDDLFFELTAFKKLLKELRLESPELLSVIQMIEGRCYTEASSFS